MTHKFKIGDRVKTRYGVGTVVCCRADGMVGVEHDRYDADFHSLEKRCKEGYGYWYYDYHLTLIPMPKQELHFVRDGNVVHAILKIGDTTTRAKATCSPDDEFDFLTGVELAKARVFGYETKIEKPAPVKVEKYKRYILKPFDEVEDHNGMGKTAWEGIKWVMAVEDPTPSNSLLAVDNKNIDWYIPADAVLREANPDE